LRPYLSVAAIAGIAASVGVAWAQQPQLAREGRGLLPPPTEMPAAVGGTPTPHPVERGPSGSLARTIFETDEDPNFKLIIRDFSFPPDRQPHSVTLPSAAIVRSLGASSEIKIDNRRLVLAVGERAAVPASVPIEVTNNGEQAMILRVLIVEAK